MYNNQLTKEQISWYNKNAILSEATGTSGSGSFKIPLSPGTRLWDKENLQPFTIKISNYDNAQLEYDSYDGSLDVSKKTAKKMESKARKLEKYIKNHPTNNDDDGNNLNGGNGPNNSVGPFNKVVKEDLAVWFGTKKKPKGSNQPKGPWVNICRKKEGGGHPPCGRPEATDKSYPKCRAAGVAARMTDSQKRSACQQKRNAEKTHSKTGTGNKPKMVHYEPKTKNESIEKLVRKLVKESLLGNLI